MSVDLSSLDMIVEWMKSNCVESLSHDGMGISIKLARPHESYPANKMKNIAPTTEAFADVDGAGVCSCGHSWVEHVDDGCLHGCSHEVCVSQSAEESKDD